MASKWVYVRCPKCGTEVMVPRAEKDRPLICDERRDHWQTPEQEED
jgi:endogenous inhibitor of DNA gyrase (YacG/DUF329 family)